MLVDTNVVLLLLQPDHPMTATAAIAMKALTAQGHELFITPQNLIEMRAVATKPADSNGLGLSPEEAAEAEDRMLGLFRLLPDTADIFPEYRRIVAAHNVTGRSVHDARLVAAMRAHGETSILTFDTGFNRYAPLIKVVNPARITPPPSPAP
jgi:predicted nucleic acid-binding protein